jgi:hypothetical protein
MSEIGEQERVGWARLFGICRVLIKSFGNLNLTQWPLEDIIDGALLE